MKYRHVIWDFDGTLFDTYPILAGALQRALAEFGIQEPFDEVIARLQVSVKDTVRFYREKHGLDESVVTRNREIDIQSGQAAGMATCLYTHIDDAYRVLGLYPPFGGSV